MAARPSTRDRIIDAGMILIWRLGYNAVSVDSICLAADIRKGSFYHAFPAKEDLLVAVISHVWAIDLREIQHIYGEHRPLIDRFGLHLEWFGASQRRLKARHGFVPGLFNMALDFNVPDGVRQLVRRLRDDHQDLLRSVIHGIFVQRGCGTATVDFLTEVTSHVIAGVVNDAKFTDSLAPFETLPETVFALLGLAPPPSAGSGRKTALPDWVAGSGDPPVSAPPQPDGPSQARH
jgi:TetR/AcrR family transcriptional repressor of nem operon